MKKEKETNTLKVILFIVFFIIGIAIGWFLGNYVASKESVINNQVEIFKC